MPKLLVIDDEAPLTTLIARFFTNAGFEVDAAVSGQEGLARALDTQPDAILLDIMMPDIDGYEVCRRLRADIRTMRTPIVALTARAQPVDRQTAMRAGADLHVVKPFSGKVLVQQVEELMIAKATALPPSLQAAVVRLKAGVGATTLAANLAVALGEQPGRLAAVVNLSPAGGQLERVLGLPAETSSDGRSGADGTPASWVVSHLVRHASGMFVLPRLPVAANAAALDPTYAGRSLETLRRWFDYIIVDTPLTLGSLAPVLLASSGLVLLVLPAEPSAARAAQVAAAAIQKHAGRRVPIWPVLTGPQAGDESIQGQMKQVLGVPAVLPWEPDSCAQAEASQQAIVAGQPRSALASAIRELAGQVRALAGTMAAGAGS